MTVGDVVPISTRIVGIDFCYQLFVRSDQPFENCFDSISSTMLSATGTYLSVIIFGQTVCRILHLITPNCPLPTVYLSIWFYIQTGQNQQISLTFFAE